MFIQMQSQNLLDLEQTIAKELFMDVKYPWEVLCKITDFILKTGPTLPQDKYEQIGENIWVAKSATVAPSASLTGPLIIGEGAEIRHCAFIRGNAIVGDGAVVGNSTEIKGSILFNGVQTPHYNYIGDSILGYKAHTGAGTITSNLKADKTEVSITMAGMKLGTGLKKMGAIIGDNVEVGCNSVLNPGTVIGRESNIYPLSMVRGFVPKRSIYKQQSEIIDKVYT